MANFTATARIPSRPLSMANKELAEKKELLVDYENHEIYICDLTGAFVNVTASVTAVVKEMEEKIKNDPTIITNVKITLPDGSNVTIDKAIYDAFKEIEELKKLLKYDDKTGDATISIPPSSIDQDKDNRFVSDEEKTNWNNKSTVFNINTTIKSGDANWTGSSAPYTQTITVAQMKESYYPVVDVHLSDDYALATKEINDYSNIFKILTYDGSIKVYSTKATSVDLSIIMKIDTKENV